MVRICQDCVESLSILVILYLFSVCSPIDLSSYVKRRKKPKEIPAKDFDQLLLAVLLIIISSINDVENVICLSSMMRTSSLTFSSIKQSIDQVSIFFSASVYPRISFIVNKLWDMLSSDILIDRWWLLFLLLLLFCPTCSLSPSSTMS